ncbi:MAG TPA: TIGR04283 family arsenosugar biosynthesis glycosyltransferase [Pyrinomonadaceae bacterium]|nr:TIGR04283 family arsenosugar biosynthesis glycosyltransferase [Pyrinomonadaceae bacterium]
MGRTPGLSVIIPTLNEARALGETLAAVAALPCDLEVIVVDGGSVDGTAELVRGRGVRLITSGRGRGLQMDAGARAARGVALWFLHADTRPAPECAARIAEALEDPGVVAGNFGVSFDGGSRGARLLTWLYPRLRRLGLCYGDSAIFVRREAYEEAGGFASFPIFEDLDLVRRLRRRGRVVHLPAVVTTSSRRFEGRSFAVTFARWAFLQALYWAGVHPRTLGRMYAPVREGRQRRGEGRAPQSG